MIRVQHALKGGMRYHIKSSGDRIRHCVNTESQSNDYRDILPALTSCDILSQYRVRRAQLFEPPQQSAHKRWDISLLVSFAAHGVLLLVLTHHSAPVFIMPSDVALGTPASSGSVIYLAPIGAERVVIAPEKPRLDLHASAPTPPSAPQPIAAAHESESAAENAKADATAAGGSLYGSRTPGSPLTGHEIIPALPQVFPDPAVSRGDLPPGVQGDVIVEVTIDQQGNVVETKLIQGIGYGIEDRVLATLRQWRFRPASKDGMTIASQHIVHFHYPS
jgi:TonB family protein